MIRLKVKHLIVVAGVVSTGFCVTNTNAYAKTLGETTKPIQVESMKIVETIKSEGIAKENIEAVTEKKEVASDLTEKIETKNDSIKKNEKVETVEKVETKIDLNEKVEDKNHLDEKIESKNNSDETTDKTKTDLAEKIESKDNSIKKNDKVETVETVEKAETKTDLAKQANEVKPVKEKEELSKITINGTTITGDSENGVTINLNNGDIGNYVYHINNSYNGTTVMFLNIANDLSYTAHNIYATYCDTYDTAMEVYEAKEDIKETVEDLTTVSEVVNIIPKESSETLKDLKTILNEDKQETVKGMAKLGAKAVVSAVVCGGTVATVDKMVSAVNQIDTVKDEPHSILSPVTKKINHACDVIRTKMCSVRVAVKASKAYIKTKHTLISVKSTVSNWFNW